MNTFHLQAEGGSAVRYVRPAVDVIEDAEGLTLYADLPGAPKDALDLTVESTTLTLAAGIRLEGAPKDGPHSAYRRVFSLPRDLDTAQMAAEFRHGVLKLRIPKAARAQPRRVDVQVG